MKKPEILAPAGDYEKLQTAFLYGADACYMGMPVMSMRVRENEIKYEDIEKALRLKNKLGKKIYLTMNIHAHESRINFLEKETIRLKKMHNKKLDPDGILVSDAGIFSILKEKCPWIPLHISTQANILNSSAVEYWVKQGAERIVLGREVSLRELKQIRTRLKKRKVDTELESFVHGAMCMAYSGRCLLSSFMAARDANEGMCAHSCRWKYKVYLEEEKRAGEFIPIEEDNSGTHIMSSKDMCMIEHLKELVDAGLDSMKIEGRHKTVYYTAIAVRAYRQALDLAMDGKKPTSQILEDIESINTRGYFTGFWHEKPGALGQNYDERSNLPAGRQGYNDNYCFAGVIKKIDKDMSVMEVRNRLNKGDKLDIITPKNNISLILDDFQNAETGEKIESASAGQGFRISFKAPSGVQEGFVVRKRL